MLISDMDIKLISDMDSKLISDMNHNLISDTYNRLISDSNIYFFLRVFIEDYHTIQVSTQIFGKLVSIIA